MTGPNHHPATDIFIAEVTGIGTAVGGYVPHAFKEKTLDTSTYGLVDKSPGRTGTATIEPLLTLTGNALQTGDLVFARQRGWTQGRGSSKAITGATNANPIVITAANHGLATGDTVVISGVGGNTAANGTWTVTVIDANTFSIPTAGSGSYTSGGTAAKVNANVVYECLGVYGGHDSCVPVVTAVGCVGGQLLVTTKYLRGSFTVSETPCNEMGGGTTVGGGTTIGGGAGGGTIPPPGGGGTVPPPGGGGGIVPPPPGGGTGTSCLEQVMATCSQSFYPHDDGWNHCVNQLFQIQCGGAVGGGLGDRDGPSGGVPTPAAVGPGGLLAFTDGRGEMGGAYMMGAAYMMGGGGLGQYLAHTTLALDAVTTTGVYSAAALTADADNYAPVSPLPRVLHVTTDGGGARAITGLAGGAAGMEVVIINVHSTDAVTLTTGSGSSSAANRFFNGTVTPPSVSLAPAGGLARYVHNGTNWRLAGTVT